MAAVLALVLVAAAVTVARSPGADDPAAQGGGGAASSATGGRGGARERAAGGDQPTGTGGDQATGTGGDQGGAATAVVPSGAGPAGTAATSGNQPGAAGTGTTGGLTGGDPVPLRPPVRCASTGPPRAGPLPSKDERDGLSWVTVSRLAGSCDASSPAFRLLGIDTRLVWRSDADSFAVFLVDSIQGRDATAGFADGQCAGTCSQSQPLVPAAGTYTLEVQAGAAAWEVEIQEYRRT